MSRESHQQMNHALLAFYRGEQGDFRERTIDQILTWSDDELEVRHDYIQWLFPLDQPSAFNPHAPLLDHATITAMREDALMELADDASPRRPWGTRSRPWNKFAHRAARPGAQDHQAI